LTRLYTRFDRFALGRLPTGTMNKTETAYASHLDLRKLDGGILWYKFEGIKLRLADNTFYTVDFPLMRRDGAMEMHEIKGFMQDDQSRRVNVSLSILHRPKSQNRMGHGSGTEPPSGVFGMRKLSGVQITISPVGSDHRVMSNIKDNAEAV
jgi:hypothetical protein